MRAMCRGQPGNHMNIFHAFAAELQAVLASLPQTASLPAEVLARVTVEPPRDASHGDLSTNAAMVLAKEAKANPRVLAEAITGALNASGRYVKVEVAGPGFINIALNPSVFEDVLRAANAAGVDFGRSKLGQGRRVNVEYVSANPTGPMHVGHGRGAVLWGRARQYPRLRRPCGDCREYYINDAGAQVDVLARSAFHALSRGAGKRRSARSPRGSIPAIISKPVGKALADRQGLWRQARRQARRRLTGCRWCASEAIDAHDGNDPRGSRGTQHPCTTCSSPNASLTVGGDGAIGDKVGADHRRSREARASRL